MDTIYLLIILRIFLAHVQLNFELHLANIFTMDLRDWFCEFVELSPPKPLDQSKNVIVRTFHTWPGSVHEHIFLALGDARGPRRHVLLVRSEPEGPYVVR